MELKVGKTYLTRKAGTVQIVEDLGAGRKRYIGHLANGERVSYFRNGAYSNANKSKGGHAYDIVSDMPLAVEQKLQNE